MTVLNKFNELLRCIHENKVIEKISVSDDKHETYEREKNSLMDEINSLREIAKCTLEDHEHIFRKDDFQICPEDSLEICMICMMTGIDDYHYFFHWITLVDALRDRKGDQRSLAVWAAYILDEELDLFSEFSEYEIIDKIFSQC